MNTIIIIIIFNLKAFYVIFDCFYDVDVQSICQKHRHIHLFLWYFYTCKANDWVKSSEYVGLRDETHGISGVFLNMVNNGNNSIK